MLQWAAFERSISAAPKHQQLPLLSGNALTQHSTRRPASCMGASIGCQTLSAPPQFTFSLSGKLPARALLLWLPRDFNSLSCAGFWLDTFSGTRPRVHMIGQGLSEAGTWLIYPALTYSAQSPSHKNATSGYRSSFVSLLIMFKGLDLHSVSQSVVSISRWPHSRATSGSCGGATVSMSVRTKEALPYLEPLGGFPQTTLQLALCPRHEKKTGWQAGRGGEWAEGGRHRKA